MYKRLVMRTTEPLRRLAELFDATSGETTRHGVYVATRPREGVYSITSTQSAESTYAADETRPADEGVGTASFDCENPRTCRTCNPIAAGD